MLTSVVQNMFTLCKTTQFTLINSRMTVFSRLHSISRAKFYETHQHKLSARIKS
jgi:hypothetical protein